MGSSAPAGPSTPIGPEITSSGASKFDTSTLIPNPLVSNPVMNRSTSE